MSSDKSSRASSNRRRREPKAHKNDGRGKVSKGGHDISEPLVRIAFATTSPTELEETTSVPEQKGTIAGGEQSFMRF